MDRALSPWLAVAICLAVGLSGCRTPVDAHAASDKLVPFSGADPILTEDASTSPAFSLGIPVGHEVTTVGVWYKGDPADKLQFVFREGSACFTLREEGTEGAAETYRPRARMYTARFNDWTWRQVRLRQPGRPLVLESIQVTGSKACQRAISPPRLESSRPSGKSDWVWKLKDFDPAKPSSLVWTAVRYYEYGWDRPSRLHPWALKSTAGSAEVAELRVVLCLPDGTAVWATRLSGAELTEDLALPRLAEGTYLVEVAASDRQAKLLTTGRLVYQVLRDDSGGVPLDSTPDVTRLLPRTALPLQAACPYTLQLSTTAGDWRKPLALHWRLENWEEATVSSGEETFDPSGAAKVMLAAPATGAYTFQADILDARGGLVDRFSSLLACPAAPDEAPKGTADVASPAVCSLSLMVDHYDPALKARLPTETLPALIEWTDTACMTPVLIAGWDELEPVSGCYQWQVTDAMIARSGQAPVWLGIGFTGDKLPGWLWFEELMDQNQMTIRESYHYVSPFGPRFSSAQKRLMRALISHYRGDPRVGGYLIYPGPSEGFLTDTADSICDYSPPAREAFRAFLQRQYVDDLAALNEAWQSSFGSWREVQPPVPDWSLPWEISAAWLDFHDFKADFVVERMTELTRLARSLDPDRPMMAYGKEGFGSTGRLAKVYRDSNIRYSNGGGETMSSYIQTCIMRNHGVAANPEGHFVMPNTGSVAMVMANSIWAGGFEGQNIMWGLVYAKTPHVGVAEYAHISELSAALATHQDTLHKTTASQPWAGYFCGLQSMLRTRSFRTALYPQASTLMTVAGTKLHNLCSWVDDDSSLDAMRAYPLIVDSGSTILSPASLETLLDYVRQGGTLLASTDTARYYPGDDSPADGLAKMLGADHVESIGGAAVDATGEVAISSLTRVIWPASAAATAHRQDERGTTLVWSIPLGKGTVYLVSGSPDFRRSAPFLHRLIDQATGMSLPYQIEAENLTVRPLRGEQADYLPFVLWPDDLSKRGLHALNHTWEDLQQMPKRPVTLSGLPASVHQIRELLTGQVLPVTDGAITQAFTPGLLHILVIDHVR